MPKREAPSIRRTEYVYRRRLAPQEMLPAIGVGLGVGAFAFYITYLVLQRTPLDTRTRPARTPTKRLPPGAAA